jgi:putative acetyltransferase
LTTQGFIEPSDIQPSEHSRWWWVKVSLDQSDPASYPDTVLRRVNWSTDLVTVRRLFQDYRKWLAEHQESPSNVEGTVPAGLGSIDKETAELPGVYGPPRGEIILAFKHDALVACGALRGLGPKLGEIKRVYVRADHRGPGFGPRLTQALLDRARELGYARVRVDTLPTMTAAIEFYQEMGFKPIPPYWPHPVPGALFFEYRVPSGGSVQRNTRVLKAKRPGK